MKKSQIKFSDIDMEIKIESIEKNEKEDHKKATLQKLKSITKEWKKMPDSWIIADEYSSSSKEALDQKRKNKFRANYFHVISISFEILSQYLNDEDKKKFREDLDLIVDKVQRRMNEKLPIEESSVDDIDKFAENLIKKLEVV